MLSLAVFMRATVALRKESVDRNFSKYHSKLIWVYVALRKESVDRNVSYARYCYAFHVALRKESVDRNKIIKIDKILNLGRSPQGERG